MPLFDDLRLFIHLCLSPSHICLIIAHRVLMQTWIHPTPPPIASVKQPLETLFLMEKLDSVTQHSKSLKIFITRWCRYMEYFFSQKRFLYIWHPSDIRTGTCGQILQTCWVNSGSVMPLNPRTHLPPRHFMNLICSYLSWNVYVLSTLIISLPLSG